MRSIFRYGLAALAAALLVGAAHESKAGYAPVLVSTVQEGSNWRWTYNVVFSNLGPAFSLQTGNGTLSPGTTGTQDFITLYDIVGYVAGSAVAGGSHTLLTPLVFTGVTGPFTAPNDSPDLVNLVFRFSAGSQTSDATFTGFSFLSSVGPAPQNTDGFYTSQYTTGSGSSGSKIGEVGRIILPSAAVPEPASLAMLGFGAFGLLGVLARRRKA